MSGWATSSSRTSSAAGCWCTSSTSPGAGDGEEGTEADIAYGTIREELASYGEGLNLLPEIVALSKTDLVPGEDAERVVAAWRERLGGAVAAVVGISSATGAGIDDLRRAVAEKLPEAPAPAEAGGDGGFEAEHRVYRPGTDEGFDVEPEGDGRWRVRGRGIELLVERHDLSNEEALDYLEGRLREIGVIAALDRAGFERGDEVVIGEVEFELDPA